MTWRARHTRSLTSIATIAVALVALLAVPATSLAAEVNVNETDRPPNRAVLEFEAEDDEENEVTLLYAGDDEEFIEVEIRDDGAALDPGNGCKGGDEAGEPVLCKLHRPYLAAIPLCKGPGPCSVDPVQFALENSWDTGMTIHLADGEDSFDAGDFEGEYSGDVPLSVWGGSDDDTILTSDARDEIYPGMGSDDVHSGAGNDRVSAEPTADGSDRFDLGDDPFDMLSYARRTKPVILRGAITGGRGEADELVGVDYVVGGTADDHFAGAGYRALNGGDGNDILIGGVSDDRLFGEAGNDLLYGNEGSDILVGGEGNDVFVGGAGPDQLLERVLQYSNEVPTTFGPHFGNSGGSDLADGGDGDDLIELGPGPDVAEGNSGNDKLYGQRGGDRLSGGSGNDEVSGGAGPDRLWGGPGADLVRAGLMREHSLGLFPAQEIDGWQDMVRCGIGRDRAFYNRWDRVRQCESLELVPLVNFLDTMRNRRAGTASLSISVGSPGRLIMFSLAVRKVRRQLTASVEDGEILALLPVRPRGRAARDLHRRGHVTVRIAIRYRPDGGLARTVRRKVR